MNRREFGRALCGLSAGLSAVGAGALWKAARGATRSTGETLRNRPNILLICVDDVGYGEFGFQGRATDVPTPHIDSLARHGVRFTNGYVTASYCSPSRAGLLTGRAQTRFGHELNPTGPHNLAPTAGLPRSEITLARHLRAVGYATGLVGKWHLGGADGFHPLDHGFDEFYGFLHEGHFYAPPPYDAVTSFLRKKALPDGAGPYEVDGKTIYYNLNNRDEPPYDRDNPILRGRQPIQEKAYLTDALTRESIAFIERHPNEPFFLYLAYNAVHSPMQGADPYMKRFEHIADKHRRVFAAMMSNLDDSVGAVLETLRRLNLEDNTLIVFLSDNGGPTAELTSSNAPLRGGKGSLYEGGVRVPFVMQWKSRLPGGRVYDPPILSTDIFATAAAAAETPLPADRVMDGVDLTPYLAEDRNTPPHASLYWRMGARGALRKGDWKIVGEQKTQQESMRFELYNLAHDLGETTNLADKHPQVLNQLIAEWERLNQEMVPPLWSPR